MADVKKIDALWDDSPIDVSAEVNFIWSIANKLRGPYQSDKYKDVIIPMDIIRNLEFDKQIDKMDKHNRLLSVVKAFSELDLDPVTVDNIKMGYIFEELIRKFSENAEAGDHYTGRDIIKVMVSIVLAEGCDDIFDDGKIITILDESTIRLIQENRFCILGKVA